MKSNPTSKSQQIENSNYDKFALTVMSISTLRTMLCPDWASWLPATVLTRHSKSPPSSCSNPLAASSDHWTACQKHPFCIANTVRIPSGAGMCHLDPFNVCMYIYTYKYVCVSVFKYHWTYITYQYLLQPPSIQKLGLTKSNPPCLCSRAAGPPHGSLLAGDSGEPVWLLTPHGLGQTAGAPGQNPERVTA